MVEAASSAPVTFRRFDADGARRQRDIVAQIHRYAYADRIATGDRFAAEEAFMGRFDAYTARDGLELIIAYADHDDAAQPVGQAWGWPLGPRSSWWDGLVECPDASFTHEDGTRTFALSEIMVSQDWTGRGIAHGLHDELLKSRSEQRATLLVRPDNPAYTAYTHWGWRRAARLRPNLPDAPLFDVLILSLPFGAQGAPVSAR